MENRKAWIEAILKDALAEVGSDKCDLARALKLVRQASAALLTLKGTHP